MRGKKIFCIYGFFSISWSLNTIEFLDTYAFINNSHQQSSGISVFLCKYYIVISDTLVGTFLDVLFFLLAVILSELHEKSKRKDWVTEKSTQKYLREGYHFFNCTLSILRFFAAFFIYSLSLPKWHTCGMAAVKTHILLWVEFCGIISWVNSRKYENL